MSNTERCDFCGEDLGKPIYFPNGSLRNMGVLECCVCGLLQSASLAPYEASRVVTLSCDADWGNVRHGKGARFDAVKPILRSLPWDRINRVVDIGSSRGDFVRWVASEHSGKEIYALEPDASVTSGYESFDQNHPISVIHAKLADVALPPCDLIYLMHTLEHADSMNVMLARCYDILSDDGTMVLEVPNIAALADKNNVEEFFIDKHNFHFEHDTFVEMLKGCGFDVAGDHTDKYNITLLLSKRTHMDFWPAQELPDYDTLIAAYSANRWHNRAKLSRIVGEKLSPLAKRAKVAYWGAGRIFDAMVKYGGLEARDVACLVDQHLHGIVDETHGCKILHPKTLAEAKPDVLVVLARSSASAIKGTAQELGIRWVVTFDELMEQA